MIEPAVQIPTIGRIVIVPMDPMVNAGAGEAPAIISYVHPDGAVDVRVFANRNDVEWRSRVIVYSAKLSALPGAREAWWPPRAGA